MGIPIVFTLEQVLSVFGALTIVLGGLFAVYRLICNQIDRQSADINSKFRDADIGREQFRDRFTLSVEALRVEMVDRVHALANKMQLANDHIEGRIDLIPQHYARRDDVLALTLSMNNLTGRIDGLLKIAQWKSSTSSGTPD